MLIDVGRLSPLWVAPFPSQETGGLYAESKLSTDKHEGIHLSLLLSVVVTGCFKFLL